MIETPYLLFLGDAPDDLAAKVAQGIADWRPDNAVGQLRLPGCRADVGKPDMTLEEGRAAGARTLIVGVANRGGVFADAWRSVMIEALGMGYDVASGLHTLLRDQPDLVAAAKEHGGALHDVRLPQGRFPIAEGTARPGRRALCVGTDCSVGKMYTGMAMDAEMKRRGLASSFRATGQTGILITGAGIPLDAIVADFMSGAVEQLTPGAEADHWDHVEGQGSLWHVSFSGVTLALIHGARPDALVLCHEPTRRHMRGLPEHPLPSLEALRDMALPLARIANPEVRVVGVSLNTKALGAAEAEAACRETGERLGLPCVDPYRHGAGPLVDALVA